jgi:hypothetical protein
MQRFVAVPMFYVFSYYARREVWRVSQLSELPADSSLPQCLYLLLFTPRQIAEMVLRKIILKNTIF